MELTTYLPSEKERLNHDDLFETFDPSLKLNNALYCAIVENMQLGCFEMNVADIWKFNEDQIGNLTEEDIRDAINSVHVR